MDYFKYLSIIFGGWMILGGLWFAFGIEWWKKAAAKLYPEKRPLWIHLSSLAVLALVGWTWFEFLKHLSAYAFIVTFVVSLSLVKILLLSFFYQKYRRDMITYIRSFLNDNEMLTLKNIVDKLPNYKVK